MPRLKKNFIVQKKVNYNLNENIKFDKLIVITPTGEKTAPLTKQAALEIADSYGLDLLVVNPQSSPVIAKILDYKKNLYETEKRKKKLRKHQKVIVNKEIRMKAGIGLHDMMVKVRKAQEFIKQGAKVKVSLRFRGREASHPQVGYDLLNDFLSHLKEIAEKEKAITRRGMFLDMYLAPMKQKKTKKPQTPNLKKKQ